MQAWIVDVPRPVDRHPLVWTQRDVPEPGTGEVLVRVATCGVCRTDLHVAAGDLPVHRPHVIPGHEVVGYVEATGAGAARFSVGTRIGIAWLRHTCGSCRFCIAGRENLCDRSRYTGWDADGGYAEYAVVDERYAYLLPEAYDEVAVAPLLCAGIIGYRALERAEVPLRGRLGIYGFGGSAHIAAQIALHRGTTVHVIDRARSRHVRSPWSWAARPPGRLTPPHLSHSMRPSCSRLQGIWSRTLSVHWIWAAPSPSRASI